MSGSFQRSKDIPEGYAPFNAKQINDYLKSKKIRSVFVLYAQQNPEDLGEELGGTSKGYVAEFDLVGRHLRTFSHSMKLNAPWAISVAPKNFGQESKGMLIDNFGDGTIVSFDLATGFGDGTIVSFDLATGRAKGFVILLVVHCKWMGYGTLPLVMVQA